MTLGWAARCVDGVVLIGDSMKWVLRPGPDGVLTDVWAECRPDLKIRRIGDRAVAMMSGTFSPGYLESPVEVEPYPLVEAGARMLLDMLEHRVRTAQLDELQDVELLVAGAPLGQLPELLRMQSDRSEIDQVPLGSSVTIGNMSSELCTEPGIRHLSKGLTTDVAIGIGISACGRFIRDFYRLCGKARLGEFSGALANGSGGAIPSVAFPLRVAVITIDHLEQYDVERVGDVTAADIAAADALKAAAMAADAARGLTPTQRAERDSVRARELTAGLRT